MKKFILLFSFFLCFQYVDVLAQRMSDDDIVQFVLDEQEKGTSQNKIATILLKKGVSPERLRNIKKEYDSKSSLSSMDYSNVAGSVNGGNSRLRTKKQGTELLNDDMPFLDVEFLLNYEKMHDKNMVFGRDIFRNEYLTFEPSMNVPTPADYVLGPGDQLFIDVWGASKNMISCEISPEGKIIVDGVGPISLAGKTVKEANEYVGKLLGELYADSNISLTVGAIRTIQVQVLGEVIMPGTYKVSALSTAFNALYAAGGTSDFGTLRDIKVFRKGKLISSIDVYDYIFNGKIDQNVRLEDDDVISVGAYSALVNIQGKVKRPQFYEMKENEPLSKLLEFTGGFKGDAYKEKVRIVRKSGREYSLHTVNRKDMSSFTMCDGDSVHVDSVIPRFSNMVEASGAVFYPGFYELNDETSTVLKVIEAAGGIREDAFLSRAILFHRNLDKTMKTTSLDLEGIINGSQPDITLKNNDCLYIPSNADFRGKLTIEIRGEVNFPGTYEFSENTKIEDAIIQAGGLTRSASMAKVDVFRRLYDPMAKVSSDIIAETFTFEIRNGLVISEDSAFVLEPFDEVRIRRSPVFEDVKLVSVDGAVNFKGEYGLTSKTYRLSDLVKAAGGLSSSAYVGGAYLFRKLTDSEKNQQGLIQKMSRVELYEEAVRSIKGIDIAVMDSIYKTKIGAEDVYPVAINLEKALKKPGGDYDIILREGDVLTIPEMVSTVKIRGEVKYPTTVSWQAGKSLKHYVEQAGGYSNIAKKRSTYVIYMNGTVKKLSRTSKNAILPGCEIVVPRKKIRKMTTAEIVSIGTASMSVTTMIVTLYNMLKK